MERQALVHSFHSQVVQSLQRLDEEPDLIVALDSHLDVSMGMKNTIRYMPKNIRLAAGRASAHFLIRRALGDIPILLKTKGLPLDSIPEMILVTPQTMLNQYVFENIQKIRDLLISGSLSSNEFDNPLEDYLEYLSKVLGIKVFTSPPKNLMKLVDVLRDAEYRILDIDVDFLHEMQTECYSPIKNAQLGQLGSIAQTLRLIRKTKPHLVTISEVKVAAIQEPKSRFSKFINRLKSLGYKIHYELAFDNDGKAERVLEIYREFYETVQKPLERKQRMESDFLGKEAINRHIKQLAEATKQYFRQVRNRLS